MFRRVCFVFCVVLSSHAAAQGKVWVVDDQAGPGIDFTTLPEATAAAGEGDTILVKPGYYPQLVDIDGKSLLLIGPPPPVTVYPGAAYTAGIRVRNLTAGQRVVLRNLSPTLDPTGSSYDKLLLEDNAGTVWIEDCTVKAPPAGTTDIKNCAEVVLLRSIFQGGTSASFLEVPGIGVRAVSSTDSSVHAYECEFRGGHGDSDDISDLVSSGGDGFGLTGGFLFAADCAFIGGDSGMISASCHSTVTGGDGLQLYGWTPAPAAETLGCTFQGGAFDPSCAGSPGLPVKVYSGAFVELTGLPCSLDVQALVSEGKLLTLTFAGAPDAAAFLALSLAPDALYFAPFVGSLLLGAPYAVVLADVLNPAGSLQLDVPVGFLPPGVAMLPFYGQLGLFLSDGSFQLCSGSAVTLLDEQY